ncbi:MAG: DUF551 domain-containing protein [Aeriscardovia sp.]|nr:DUF551 domain-containing protein [Aeriscardovia sp.]
MKSRQELIDYLVMCAGWSIKDDAISRVDVIKAVHDEMYDEHTDKTGSLRLVMNFIGDMPSVNTVPQWIPCSERLPKDAEEYLITIKPRHGDTFVKKTMYFPDDELWWDISPFETVTAWMPVPKPYEVEK